MKLPFTNLFAFAAATLVFAVPGLAQDTTPPVVATPIGDVTVKAGAAPTVINLKKTFSLQGVTGKLYRFSTTEGNVDVEMLAQSAPKTVAAFLGYANTTAQNSAGVFSYTNTLIQRAVPGFIVQGGGFYVDASGSINQINGRVTIPSEAGLKNTRGTLAMALSSGPDSATGDFFFNLVDNAILDDTSDGGPFTVFGRVSGAGMSVVDAIAGLRIVDASGGNPKSPFGSVPVLPSFTGGNIALTDLVYLNGITALPLTPKVQGDAAALTLNVKVRTSSNPNLVTATLDARKVTLAYTPGQTGTAVIRVRAKDSAGTKAVTTFNVTVQ